jgi:tRNA-splicing ligase RtcB (3'-phosphate/5'-hydroxy nucleic acid ligase)
MYAASKRKPFLEEASRMETINAKLVSWASILEESTLQQAEACARMPFVYPHVALMPDAHLGLGATVGSVIPTDGAIMPAAVGVDIGCGMIAVRTQVRTEDLVALPLAKLRIAIEHAVPLSAGAQNRTVSGSAAKRIAELEAVPDVNPDGRHDRWRQQLGSLGSGNHFIEVSVDELERVWLFLHSGSRGIGNRIAQHHIAIATKLMERYRTELPDRNLAYLVEGTEEFEAYIHQLHWAQRYALLNREEMMDRVVGCLSDFLSVEAVEQERINCHHNFSQLEQHFGRTVWVSRKGAIEARPGQPGLIPGSMGSASYVVEGRGNAASLNSAPHGAGRALSRSRARKTFTHAQLREAMAGIEFRDTDAFLDEIPAAYKDIDVVIADAAELVSVRHTLRQLVNVKGN